MPRASLVRVLSLAAGLAASLTGPASALAHGHAHSEAAEHAAQHQHMTHSAAGEPTLNEPGHHEQHAHPRIDPGTFTRVLKSPPALGRSALSLESPAVLAVDASSPPPEANESPPARPGDSPEHSRAPPKL